MENIDLIAILLTIIVLFIAIWIFRRVLIIVAILIVIAVIAFLFLQSYPNLTLPQTKPTTVNLIEKFKDNYCGLLYDRDDSLICNIIIQPIYNDLIQNYDLDSLNRLNKQQLTNLIIKTATKHKKEIISALKKQNALYLWQDFVLDIKNQYLFR